ncbi:MAG: Arc family DNA-binding protein [Methylovulum sp.]|jgi:plasmid stability protein|nr:Arc family DNA-binding protein [Methylovulum sp.]
MATLTLKNIPDNIYNQLKEAAKLHHRSLNSEILYCVERTSNPHKVNITEHLALAKQLRAKTVHYLLTDEEIDKAKSDGRS